MMSATKVVVDSVANVLAIAEQIMDDPTPSPILREAAKIAQSQYESGVTSMRAIAEGGPVADNDSQVLVKESGRAVNLAMQKLLEAAATVQSKLDAQK